MAQLNDFSKIYHKGLRMVEIRNSEEVLWKESILPYVYKDGEKSLNISLTSEGDATIVDDNGVIKATINQSANDTNATILFSGDVIKSYSKVEIRWSLNNSANLPDAGGFFIPPTISIFTGVAGDNTKYDTGTYPLNNSLEDNIIHTTTSYEFGWDRYNLIEIRIGNGYTNSPYSVNIHSIELTNLR